MLRFETHHTIPIDIEAVEVRFLLSVTSLVDIPKGL